MISHICVNYNRNMFALWIPPLHIANMPINVDLTATIIDWLNEYNTFDIQCNFPSFIILISNPNWQFPGIKHLSNLDGLMERFSLFSANFATHRVMRRKISDLILKISLKREINDSFNVQHIYCAGSMTGNRGLFPSLSILLTPVHNHL